MKYILIADDEIINQTIFEEMLIDDYEIKIVDNGQECLHSIEERIPDLLLLDIAMPLVDGVEVCKRLRKLEKTKDLPIVLVSAYASKVDKETGMAAGANDYISKPFHIAEMLKQIKKMIGE